MSTETIAWTGDLDDDCSARLDGLLLRAERMGDEGGWWWSVYRDGNHLVSSYGPPLHVSSGRIARERAERAARHLDLIGATP